MESSSFQELMRVCGLQPPSTEQVASSSSSITSSDGLRNTLIFHTQTYNSSLQSINQFLVWPK